MKRNQTLVGFAILAMLSSCGLGFFLAPTVDFSDSPRVSAPDYHTPSAWAAHPLAPANTRLIPPGLQRASTPQADVFFVHPTAWMSRIQWNADFNPGPAREIVDQISMGSQASVFNGCCRIFAPRYRQATLGAFYAPQAPAQAAFELAYQDIARAFEGFLKDNPKRPFILAGHSQGSLHLMRLIQEKIAATPLQKRFVVGYLPGMGLPRDWYQEPTIRKAGILPCDSPEQTGCVAAWDTYREGAEVKGQEPVYYWHNASLRHLPLNQARQCTHPITWQAHTQPSPLSAHAGAVEMINTGSAFAFQDIIFSQKPLGIQITALKAPRKALLSARCEGSALRVPDLGVLNYPAMETQPGNYHLLDYELFWQNIRDNAQLRIQAWQSQQTDPA
ncbi:hypothetical protein COW36_12885 [bacterium (Candidatus Blackallbacteria) CG17_big_fil_post_rev_8_21_14_2_50_48_46]|uniref:DUF3089 domain-containing protein n=1 Tax=bacterium (Candidatus Blackallbacteria) CG17_big_fil_post_rev_8_21_14_2_50_48_46 TaxID=2014261 RepID=A0A2M7G542_9BACT|nr:MAG: hypothetical protein COW64_02380 [bacterium (Candidatus Blackallbacteria) CG18_big_fil_WC_8_21_14_2_50_49_26]PIW16654.1 MAG: hypothetical protein COW36_12885 [bacterium (Candidatus Blackallbacteria) CG17_big_fil_post_rev_8_21_14_2_50_48_46]PIW46160.1 MAG: hypothetical protein COW20_18140 [bacterium (Candidatus Blackallbacteria) CG13_big_fil_rev_8_21_14_2_50_49_14]